VTTEPRGKSQSVSWLPNTWADTSSFAEGIDRHGHGSAWVLAGTYFLASRGTGSANVQIDSQRGKPNQTQL
jgi:hypothetical protein